MASGRSVDDIKRIRVQLYHLVILATEPEQEALAYFEQALAFRREIGDRRGEGVSLNSIGSIYSRLEQYQEALGYYEQSLAIRREIDDRRGEGLLLYNIGSIYSRLEQYQEALGYYEQSLAIRQEISDRAGEGVSLNNIGLIYSRLGQYQEALGYYEQALAIRQDLGDRQGEGVSLNNIGLIYSRLGQYQEALGYHEQSLAIRQDLGDRAGEGLSLNNIGRIYDHLGQYQEALDYHEQALAITLEIGDRRGEDLSLNNIGGIYESLGQYQEALGYYEQSLTITLERGDRRGEGSILNSIGFIYASLRQYQEALGYFEQSLAIRQDIGDRQGEGLSLNNIGSIYSRLGQDQEALGYYEQSLAITLEIGDRRGEGLLLNNIGGIYESLGQDEEALGYYEQSLAIRQEIGDRRGEGKTLANIGRLMNEEGRPEVAIVLLKQSVDVRESIRAGIQNLDAELQQSFTNTVDEDYRFLADLLLSQGRIIEAQQVLELLKLEELREFSRSARSGLESDDGIDLNSVEQDILAEFTTLVGFGKQLYECEQPPRCAEFQTYRDQRRRQANRFNQRVDEFVQTIRANRSDDEFFYDPSRLNETAQAIVAKPGTLLIYPLVTDDQLWLLYTAAGEVAAAVPVPVSQRELGTAVVQFRELLESPHSDVSRLQATGKQLYDWMIAPLIEEIEHNQIDTLVFAQDRVTRYIPMGALWDGNQYLTQRFTLSSILSAELTDMDDQFSPSPSDTSILALGLTEEIPPNFNALPNVATELDAIVDEGDGDALGIYPGRKFLNDGFSLETLFNHVLDHRILHIATHGKFVTGTPDDSYLMLGDSNRLSIGQIEELGSDLDDVHLVVLSACETAVGGPDADGIEVAGISSYFLAAKRASAVLASLWLVNDASTSLLMQQFYEQWAQGNQTKAEALQNAQLSLLNGDLDPALVDALSRSIVAWDGGESDASTTGGTGNIPDLSHPYYWAPFILTGNGL